jgi:hypothetical protein
MINYEFAFRALFALVEETEYKYGKGGGGGFKTSASMP